MSGTFGGESARQAAAEEHAIVLHDPMPLAPLQEAGQELLAGDAHEAVFEWCYATALEAAKQKKKRAAVPWNLKKSARKRASAGKSKKKGTEIVAADPEGLAAALVPQAAEETAGARRRARAINMLNAIEGYDDPLGGHGAAARLNWVLGAERKGDFPEQALCYAAITQGAARASGITITRIWNYMRVEMAGLPGDAWREASAALHGALLRLVADRIFEAVEDSGREAAEFATHGLAHRPGRQLLRYTADDRFPDPAELWGADPPMFSADDVRAVRKAWRSRFEEFGWAAELAAQAEEMPLHEGHFLQRCEKLPLPEVGWQVLVPLVLAAGQLCAAEAGKSRGANISIENIRAVASALACRRARDAVSQAKPHDWPEFTTAEFQAVVETLCATGVWECKGIEGWAVRALKSCSISEHLLEEHVLDRHWHSGGFLDATAYSLAKEAVREICITQSAAGLGGGQEPSAAEAIATIAFPKRKKRQVLSKAMQGRGQKSAQGLSMWEQNEQVEVREGEPAVVEQAVIKGRAAKLRRYTSLRAGYERPPEKKAVAAVADFISENPDGGLLFVAGKSGTGKTRAIREAITEVGQNDAGEAGEGSAPIEWSDRGPGAAAKMLQEQLERWRTETTALGEEETASPGLAAIEDAAASEAAAPPALENTIAPGGLAAQAASPGEDHAAVVAASSSGEAPDAAAGKQPKKEQSARRLGSVISAFLNGASSMPPHPGRFFAGSGSFVAAEYFSDATTGAPFDASTIKAASRYLVFESSPLHGKAQLWQDLASIDAVIRSRALRCWIFVELSQATVFRSEPDVACALKIGPPTRRSFLQEAEHFLGEEFDFVRAVGALPGGGAQAHFNWTGFNKFLRNCRNPVFDPEGDAASLRDCGDDGSATLAFCLAYALYRVGPKEQGEFRDIIKRFVLRERKRPNFGQIPVQKFGRSSTFSASLMQTVVVDI